MRVSVFGLGKVGVSMVAAYADRGHQVIGFDIDKDVVSTVARHRSPVFEPEVETMLAGNADNVRASSDPAEAVAQSDVSFIIVPTPSRNDGSFSTEYAEAAARAIGEGLREKNGYHLVVLCSTVGPGSCRAAVLPAIEAASGKRCGDDFGFCYNPAFIALGSIVQDLLTPDMVLCGEVDARSGDFLADFYARTLGDAGKIRRLTLENAELAKLAVNSFVTAKITFANLLAEICTRLPGGDVDAVSDAIGMDRRIGRHYLTGGPGYGGPCFPRDNAAMAQLAESLEISPEFPQTIDRLNRGLADRLLDRYAGAPGEGTKRIAVLGLAYKKESNWAEESQGVQLAARAAARGFDVAGYDPLAGEMAARLLPDTVSVGDDLARALDGADCVFVTTDEDGFTKLGATDFDGTAPHALVVDLWRRLPEGLFDGTTRRLVRYGRTDG